MLFQKKDHELSVCLPSQFLAQEMDAIAQFVTVGNAIADECVEYLTQRRLGSKVGRTHRISLGDVTNLIVRLLTVFRGDDAEMLWVGKAAIKRRALACLSTTELNTEGIEMFEQNNVHVAAIPMVVRDFCK